MAIKIILNPHWLVSLVMKYSTAACVGVEIWTVHGNSRVKPSLHVFMKRVSYLLRPKGISLIPLTQMVCWGGGDNEEACSYISLNRVGLSLLTTMVMVPAHLRSMSFHSLFALRGRASGQINSCLWNTDNTDSCLCILTLLSLVIFWPVFIFIYSVYWD